VEARRSRPLSFDGLKRLGVALKRARYFITLGGILFGRTARAGSSLLDNPKRLRTLLAGEEDGLQLPLFEF
jgi:predicted DNA-binding helix-hairpin-helix protein